MKIKNHVGIDIESIDRFKKSSSDFYNRVFTQKEIKYCNSKACPEQHFAVRFAAKEATIKAIGTLDKLFYSDIEVINDLQGKPFINLLKKTKRIKKEYFSISLSHTKDLAVAFVIYLES